MRSTTEAACRRYRINLDACGSIHKSGSVAGMQRLYGWPKGGQVRVGQWIYNIGPDAVAKLRGYGELKGER